MKKTFGLITALALMIGVAATAVAQEATPMAGSPAAEESLLAGLGYPDLTVTFDGSDFVAPEEIAAGRYRLVFENISTDTYADFSIVQPPEGMSAADAIAEVEAATASGETPELFYTATLGGGAGAPPGATSDAIVTLTPGEWVFDLSGEEGESLVDHIANVTGDLPELTDPPADVEVTIVDLAFEMPNNVPSGPSIWKVTNTGGFPHFLLIQSYPEQLTTDQVQNTLNTFFGEPATPPATPGPMLDPELIEDSAGSAVLSTGQTNWIQVNLEPGQKLAVCFISGPGDVPVHALMGMYKLFTAE